MSRKMCNLDVPKSIIHKNSEAMSKFTKIPSEIKNFFSEKRGSSVISALLGLLDSLGIDNRSLGGLKRSNCQLTNLQTFQILIMIPFFSIKYFSHYAGSALSRMFGCGKDVLYSFVSQDNVNWRNIIYRIVTGLIGKIIIRKDYKKSTLPSVLIVDDTDLPKSGLKMESVGKIFSHVHQKLILGYKALTMCWSDGRSQFVVDCSLHGEKGKVEGKEQGLTACQRSQRYSRERDSKSHMFKRKDEYFKSKIDKMIEMLRHAVKVGIPFDYLLIDSWFTCKGVVDFVCHCHKRFNLLGMAKMGKTKYKTAERGEMTAKAIISKLKAAKQTCYSRRFHCHYAVKDAVLGGRKVRLFFCKRNRKEEWKVLLTTDTKLSFNRAYEIYAMRWSIEVFFSDAKRLLDLSECSARDFSSQIAHISLVIIRYNLLATIKRSLDYETIGGLFNDIYEGVHELTVVEKIWDIILEVVAIVAEMTGADDEELIRQIIENDKRLFALREYANAA